MLSDRCILTRRQKKIGSRLDRFYLPTDLLKGLLEVSYHAYLSDYKYTTMLVMLPEVYRKSSQIRRSVTDQVSK